MSKRKAVGAVSDTGEPAGQAQATGEHAAASTAARAPVRAADSDDAPEGMQCPKCNRLGAKQVICEFCEQPQGCDDNVECWGDFGSFCGACNTFICGQCADTEPAARSGVRACDDCFEMFCADCGQFIPKPRGFDEVQCARCQPWYNRGVPASAFCTHCGSRRQAAKFCGDCGKRVCEECPSQICVECGAMWCEMCDGDFCSECEEELVCRDCCEEH